MGDTNKMDFDEEAHKLFAMLNIELPAAGSAPKRPGTTKYASYNYLDAVYQNPATGAKVFIGNRNAAESKETLGQHNITHIVNCQDPKSPNFHEKDPAFTYLRFPIAWWFKSPVFKDKGVKAYMSKLFDFVDKATAEGHGVLIHCLAGAHRAGTAGVAYIMHAAQVDLPTALAAAKRLRPVVNPIGQLILLLAKFNIAHIEGLPAAKEGSGAKAGGATQQPPA